MPTTSSPTSHRRWDEVENENEVEVEDGCGCAAQNEDEVEDEVEVGRLREVRAVQLTLVLPDTLSASRRASVEAAARAAPVFRVLQAAGLGDLTIRYE